MADGDERMRVTLVPLVSNLEPELVRRLDLLYGFYHRQWWCYRQRLNRFKFYHTLLNGLALFLVATGMIVGPVLKNSTLVACLAAVGTFVKGWNDFKHYRLHMMMSQFAYMTYAKALTELRTYARGLPPDGLKGFLIKMQTLDDIIVDLTLPIPKQCVHKYQQTYQRCEVDGKSYKNPDNPLRSLPWLFAEKSEGQENNEEAL